MFKKSAGIASMCALALTLIGCGGQSLDRNVEMGKMSFRAPSSYVEDGETDSISFTDSDDETKFFLVRFNDDPSETIDSAIDSQMETWQSIYDFTPKETKSDVIDGHECILIECVWPDDYEGVKPPMTFAFMSGSEGIYSILCQNESMTASDIVDTVSFK